MTADRMQALQTALYQRLTAELATAAPDGGAVPVFDHVPRRPQDAHVRMEAFSLDPNRTKNTAPCWHRFTIRAFDGDGSGGGVRGQMQLKGIQGAIVAALEGWTPLPGGNAVRHIGSTLPPSDTGSGFEAQSRFEIFI